MSTSQPSRALRRIASFLICGPHRALLLADLDELYQRDMISGHSRRSAGRRYAVNAVASALRVRPSPREGGGGIVSLLDFKLAVRMLAKHPMLTGVTILALGLGIPASLTPTHVWNAYMAPLPFEDGERIMGIRKWNTRMAGPARVSFGDFQYWRGNLSTFQLIGATRRAPWNVQFGDGRTESVRGAEISASTFHILRVPPELGRTIDEADEALGAENVAVIGAGLWTTQLGRTSDVIGSTVRVGGVPYTIVGVMPDGFSFPRDEVLWMPLRGEGANGLQVVGRLADGLSLAAARTEVQGMDLPIDGVGAEGDGQVHPEVVSTAAQRGELPANGDPLVYVVQALAIMLLMIVCGNVGIVIMAQTSARCGELAVRGSLGASRGRLVGQLFVEGLVLALLATGVGLVVASWSAGRLQALAGPELSMMDFGLTPRTVILALCLSLLCAGVASALPALKATKGGIQGRLVGFAGRASTMRFGGGSAALIIAELALSVGLLSYGVAWTRTVLQDTSGDMGIELDRYLSAQVLVFDPTYGADVAAYPDELTNRLRDLHVELKRHLESEPGVRAVAMADAGDLPGSRNAARYAEVEGLDSADPQPRALVASSRVDVDFFRNLGRPVLEGRDFTRADLPGELGAPRSAAIVNTTFVSQVLGGRNPIGKRLRYSAPAPGPDAWYEIVGVVGPLGLNPVNPDRDAGVYHPIAPGEVNAVGFVIDVGDQPTAFIPRLREIVAEVDPAAMVRNPMLLSGLAEREWVGLHYLALGPALFALIAILLSAAGLYAVMAFSVSQRTREIGIRAVLGASRTSVVTTIGRKAALQLGLGAVLGCILAIPVMMAVLDDPLIRPQSPVLVVVGVTTGLMLLGLAACISPARRAARIQPMEALREG